MEDKNLTDAIALKTLARNHVDNAPVCDDMGNSQKEDVVEVVHGLWERNENDKIVCTVCKNEPLLDDFGFWSMSKYCPNCGADMRGDQL
jgi:hypothetical protein